MRVLVRAEWRATESSPKPDVSFVPPLERRRLTPLERAAVSVAWRAMEDPKAGPDAKSLPVVFASRYGEIGTTLKLMRQMHDEGEMSPAGFSVSVHNAAPGALSLLTKSHAPYTAVAAGAETYEMGLLEATGRPGRVLFVYAEEETPEMYRPLLDRPVAAHAVALVLDNDAAPRIALTGGIACGKSLVAKSLNELGVETIDADDVVHGIIPDPAERRRLAAEVFADPEKRKALEARIHPQVRARIECFLDRKKEPSAFHLSPSPSDSPSPSPSLRIAVIPLLFETHWDADYDIICCVTSERETQISRMMTTRGYTRDEAEARLAAQLPVAEKAAKSHYVIENDGSPDELKLKVARLVDWLNQAIQQSNNPTIQQLTISPYGRRI